MSTQKLITELQSLGLRLLDAPDPGSPGQREDSWTSRRGGAGPTDHAAVTLDGVTVMVPVHTERAASSPLSAQLSADGVGVVERDGEALARIQITKTPRFYRLSTRDGVPYPQIALLHGTDVLASTVLQTCVRYADPATACGFCAIGQSLAAGRTLAKKTPEQLAEVAEAAARLDGVRHVTLTTGTPRSPDRGAAHLADCARAIKASVDLPVQAQCEPPDDFEWFERMRAAGVDSLGMHLEAVEDEVRAAVLPGKAEVSVARYFEAFEAAVRVFGRGQVSTYLIAGLGDAQGTLIAASERLIAIGVYPFIVPLVPLGGTRLEGRAPPSGELMRSLYAHVGPLLEKAGLRSSEVKAGCARCGACSALSSFETMERASALESSDDHTLHVPAGREPDSASCLSPLAESHLLRRAKAVQNHR
jgi:radical SAM protein (TIGR04043 family)